MHPLKGRKQTAEHIENRMKSMRGKTRKSGGGRTANTSDVLWSKVDKRSDNECWPWMGFRNKQGYGRTWINGHGYYAHRVIYDLANPGEITLSAPTDKNVSGYLMHSCDNPCCCNPAHLIVGTHQENMDDKKNKGRTPDFSFDRGPRCKLTMVQAREARALRAMGKSVNELAKLFNISIASMKTLLAGKSYRER